MKPTLRGKALFFSLRLSLAFSLEQPLVFVVPTHHLLEITGRNVLSQTSACQIQLKLTNGTRIISRHPGGTSAFRLDA